MKTVIGLFSVILMVMSCDSAKKPMADSGASQVRNDTVRIANEELEYEVIIIDPGFTYWLASMAQPRSFYTQNLLEARNRVWISEWNNRFMQQGGRNSLYGMQINYDPTIDYGFEVNYLIYNYLVYFQNKNRQRLGGNVPSR